eukprot:1142141-Rhodomonas_salina.4
MSKKKGQVAKADLEKIRGGQLEDLVMSPLSSSSSQQSLQSSRTRMGDEGIKNQRLLVLFTGGVCSGKTTIVNRLPAFFNTSFAHQNTNFYVCQENLLKLKTMRNFRLL